jgi:HEAT repeat protein
LQESADPAAAYAGVLRRRLYDDSLQHFIPLTVRQVAAGHHGAVVSLTRLIVSGTEKRVVVLGNPGAGKTTLAKQLCTFFLDMEHASPPVFIEMKRYHPDRRDVQSLLRAQLQEIRPGREPAEPHEAGLIVFDGLNEVPDGMIYDALAEIQEVADPQAMADIPIVLTCRTIDYPLTFWTQFSRYEVQSPDEGQALDYLEQRLGEQRARHLWDQLRPQMRSLCRSPLLLGMLAFVLEQDSAIDGNLPRSRSAVYSRFLSRLDARTRERARMQTPEDIRDSCYSFLAYTMQNQRFASPLKEMRRLVTEFFEPSWGIPIGVFQREILDLPPMGTASAGGPDTDSRSFMHQSFQEYYTALHLERALRARTADPLKLADLAPLLKTSAVSWRETFAFLSGMLGDSTELVRACRSQHNIPLAAACIEHADRVSPAEVDEFICEVLEEFKYGEAFDYQLVFYLQGVTARRSPGFPQRVVNDIEYWCSKYSRVTPQEIGDTVPDAEVLAMTAGGSLRDRLDAVWTLGRRRCQAAVPVLEGLAQTDPDSLVRENAVVALGRIEAPGSLLTLLGIATSPTEDRWVRTYAIHALGCYASPRAVEVLLTGLNGTGWETLADDAAWALSVLAESSPDLLRPSLPELFRALRSNADCYTKGCVLFIMGCGRFAEAVEGMIHYLEGEPDPYILEDGCHALGVLGDQASVPLLSLIADPRHTPDPMTRRQAIRSLVLLGQGESVAVQASRQDPVAYVRRIADNYNRSRN